MPRRFAWGDQEEQIWDLFLDDDSNGNLNRYYLLGNHFDSIGMACNCDPVVGSVCIIELGKNLIPLLPVEYNNLVKKKETPVWRDTLGLYPDPGKCYPEMPDYYFCMWT